MSHRTLSSPIDSCEIQSLTFGTGPTTAGRLLRFSKARWPPRRRLTQRTLLTRCITNLSRLHRLRRSHRPGDTPPSDMLRTMALLIALKECRRTVSFARIDPLFTVLAYFVYLFGVRLCRAVACKKYVGCDLVNWWMIWSNASNNNYYFYIPLIFLKLWVRLKMENNWIGMTRRLKEKLLFNVA